MPTKKENVWLEFGKSILGSLIFVMVLTNFILKPIQINQSSMYPTLKDQQLGFSNILSYRLFGLEQFDVVIVWSNQLNDYLVKRVIARPSDTIEVKNGQLYINQVLISEDFLDKTYVDSFVSPFTQDFGPLTMGEDEVFLMGDNRPYSSDSRQFGAFKLEDILSKDVYIFYPLNELRWVGH